MIRFAKVLAFCLVLTAVLAAAPAARATVFMFDLHDHPDGAASLPSYGLRIDDLLEEGIFTFSFDYSDVTRTAMVTLDYDDVAGTVTIFGWAFGGKDVGSTYDPAMSGWVYLDFTYSANISERDDCGGAAGEDVYSTAESASNGGTVTLDGWGGDQVFAFTDKANGTGCSFIFDNDTDSKGNATLAGNPFLYSGSGWLMPTTSGYRDWLFYGDGGMVVPNEDTSWGTLKAAFR